MIKLKLDVETANMSTAIVLFQNFRSYIIFKKYSPDEHHVSILHTEETKIGKLLKMSLNSFSRSKCSMLGQSATLQFEIRVSVVLSSTSEWQYFNFVVFMQ